jgi:hypothetical protein
MSVDLQVKQVFVQGYDQDGVVREGKPFYISAEYHNASDHSSGPFQVTFVLDGHTQHAIDVFDAGASESQWVQWPTDGIVAGVHRVRVGFAGVEHESEHLSEAYDQEFHVAEPPVSAVARDGREEADLANGYVDAERTILQKWRDALNDFQVTMTSSTSAETKPDFAGAVLKVFGEKVLGELTKATHSELVIGTLKAVVEASEKAKAASVSVALRDFFHQHLTAISELDAKFFDAKEKFAGETRAKAAGLLADGNADGYAAFRANLISLHDDAATRVHLPLDAYVNDLAVQWMSQSIKDDHYDVAIHIRILEGDLSVLDFKIDGPDGDKLTEHLGAERGGVDLWALKVPRSIAYYAKDGEYPAGYVHLDAANRLIESAAEQNVSRNYKQVYERLRSQGHLFGHNKK